MTKHTHNHVQNKADNTNTATESQERNLNGNNKQADKI